MIKHEIKGAKKLLREMYRLVRSNLTAEQWQAWLEEVKRARMELDGTVLEGAELEETAKANLLYRIAAQAVVGGKWLSF